MTTTAPTAMSTLMAPGPKLLRLSLRLDAVVTGVNGLAYLALSGPIENLLGLDRTIGIGIGVFLTLYGITVALIGRPAHPSTTAARGVAALNTGWVLLSLAALFVGGLDLTLVGAVWTVMQAGTVGAFAALQFLGIRKAS
ncbi:hypothetical protein [Nocardia goodfellowii]|uniref:Integral membrane protein n=1 Tax=Nocardia goodfellowii TaxID=882446 RepID=A0ABS4Q9K4_9NOCA|nr:hypothetical protein [Nocardia goodfellowii]MBP2188376.1 hypothetical protein [Nocardia goodfellowii]